MAGKTFEGSVTSNKMQKTLVVSVSRRYQETRTGKIVSSRKKVKIHSELAGVNIGDLVEFVESRPLSKDKKFRLIKVLKKAAQASSSVLDADQPGSGV
jgi:small subunit ribosomal protein S17